MKNNEILKRVQSFLYSFYAKDISKARLGEIYDGLVNALMQDIGKNWHDSKQIDINKEYYILSFEYKPGKLLEKAVNSSKYKDQLIDFLKSENISFKDLLNYEKEISLGLSDIARGSWYLLRALSKNKIKTLAYALRYESGSMRQVIKEGKQYVNPNSWLYRGNKWEHRKSFSYILNIEDRKLRAVCFDMPVINSSNNFVNTLRMWKSESIDKINYLNLSMKDVSSIYSDYVKDNSLTQFLYLDNSSYEGKMYRLKQEYFYCLSSIQDIFRRYFKKYDDICKIDSKISIVLADIHPSLSIIVFLKTLINHYGLDIDKAFDLTKNTFSHIAFLLTPETRESYEMAMVKKIDKNLYKFLYKLDIYTKNKLDIAIIKNGYLIYENINFILSHKFYFLSKIYKENSKYKLDNISYLNYGIDRDMYSFSNNKNLGNLLKKYGIYGNSYKEIEKLGKIRENEDFYDDLEKVKFNNKISLIKDFGLNKNDKINPYSIFDMQVSEFHEAKRQLLNAISIACIYYKLKENSNIAFNPTTFIFSGLANDGYFMAKEIIKFILALKKMIDKDPLIKNKLKIIFVEDINVEKSKILYPACDIYSNLNLPLYDNQSFEMLTAIFNFSNICSSRAGIIENLDFKNSIYKFGQSFKDFMELKDKDLYNFQKYYYSEDLIKNTLDRLINESYSNLSYDFKTIYDYLLKYNDSFFVCMDLEDLINKRFKINKDYLFKKSWTTNQIDNLIWANEFNLEEIIRKGDYGSKL